MSGTGIGPTTSNCTGRGTAETRIGHVRDRPVLITGGAGFVGCNVADRLASEGHAVLVYDNLGRANVEQNLAWLQRRHGGLISVQIADIRDAHTLRAAVRTAGFVFHFAGQVAVTTSLADPLTDFEVNARGTLNLLEAIRAQSNPPPLVFASTNKVYGKLSEIPLLERDSRYIPLDPNIADWGISEAQPLCLYSPYGCSKGAADQYVLDYAHVYGIPAVVFRMSCLYGPRQFGTEDQGWVAHFLISALRRTPITVYGDGKQVRDLLFVADVIEAFRLATKHMPRLAGNAFNIGGGSANATSLIELIDLIGTLTGHRPEIAFGPARVGDQLYYVSDTRKFTEATGWRPNTSVKDGVATLLAWLETRHRRPALPLEKERVTA